MQDQIRVELNWVTNLGRVELGIRISVLALIVYAKYFSYKPL